MTSIGVGIIASIADIETSCFGLVCEKDMSSILPSQESGNAHSKSLRIVMFMHPMIAGALIIAPDIDQPGELSLQTRICPIEGESVGAQMNPSGVFSEQSKCLARPKTIPRPPVSNI